MDAARPKAKKKAGDGAERPARPTHMSNNDPARAARWAAWQAENAEAIASSNAWVEQHGLPLARFRMF